MEGVDIKVVGMLMGQNDPGDGTQGFRTDFPVRPDRKLNSSITDRPENWIEKHVPSARFKGPTLMTEIGNYHEITSYSD